MFAGASGIEESSPMKRGLKVGQGSVGGRADDIEESSPMKRGLKG